MKDVTVFVISALLSLVTLIYIIATPKEGEHYTEFYFLGLVEKPITIPQNTFSDRPVM